MGFESLLHLSPPSDYCLFPNVKRWLCDRRFESNEGVKWETEGYFRGFDKSHYLEGIEQLKDRRTRCIELKGEYIEKSNRFLPKKLILVHFMTSISNTLVRCSRFHIRFSVNSRYEDNW